MNIGGKAQFFANSQDVLVINTPGGGGYGSSHEF